MDRLTSGARIDFAGREAVVALWRLHHGASEAVYVLRDLATGEARGAGAQRARVAGAGRGGIDYLLAINPPVLHTHLRSQGATPAV